MATYLHVLVFSLAGGLLSLAGGALLLSRRRIAALLAEYATPLAAGALIAAVFLDLLHEGLESAAAETVLVSALAGIVLFFYAERFLRWFHHHHYHDSAEHVPDAGPKQSQTADHDNEKRDATISLIIAGDLMHNALDGVAIAAAFPVSVPTGIVTTIAVAAHEIPQEIGDFGLLLAKGMTRMKVLAVNAVSALATTVLALVTFALGSEDRLPVGVLLGLSSGFLLYIALSDIIPTIHEKSPSNRLFDVRPLLLLVGIGLVALAVSLAHRFTDA